MSRFEDIWKSFTTSMSLTVAIFVSNDKHLYSKRFLLCLCISHLLHVFFRIMKSFITTKHVIHWRSLISQSTRVSSWRRTVSQEAETTSLFLFSQFSRSRQHYSFDFVCQTHADTFVRPLTTYLFMSHTLQINNAINDFSSEWAIGLSLQYWRPEMPLVKLSKK